MTEPIYAFAKCRNERLRLPAFLDHYRRLGVARFFVADNSSTDGSFEYLAAQRDVQVRSESGSFRASRSGTDWLNAMLGEFGVGHWCVTVDIDELLCYPGYEDATLPVLTEYFDSHRYEAMRCLLLDLYPGGQLQQCAYTEGANVIGAAPFFDPGPYSMSPVDRCPGVLIRGGVRERVFYPEFRSSGLGALATRALRRSPPPCLTKVPLVRWDRTSKYLDCNHWVSPRAVAPETGVLLHFKFLQDFHERALEEAARGEYYDEATEYRRYADILRATPELSLMCSDSVRYEGSAQLVALGLAHQTRAWADVIERRRR